MEAGLQRMRLQAGFLERRPERGRGRRIEPQEGEEAVMRGRPATGTARRPRGLVHARDLLEQERNAQEVAAARGLDG